MKRTLIRRLSAAASAALLAAVLCTSCGSSGQQTNMNDAVREKVAYTALRAAGDKTPDTAALEDKILAAQNDYLCLYYTEKTADISVFDRRTGLWWTSNPADPQNPAARSQLVVSTITSQGVVKQYTSYTDATARGQVEYEKAANGLLVTYTFGNKKPDLSNVPQYLTEERHGELVQRAVDAGGDKSLLTRRYIKKDGLWTRKDDLTADQAKKLSALFTLIGYTAEELAQDNAAGGGRTTVQQDDSFAVALRYTLEGDSLRAAVEADGLRYPENAIITSLEVLEYFGALAQGADGWLFIPDGSGALVDTTARTGTTGAVELPLYGRDETMPHTGYSPIGEDCLLPVFGIRRPGGGVLAVIEDNEAVASVRVAKPGYLDNYATVSAAFALNAVQNIGLSSDSISKFYITSASHYRGDTAVRYIFLAEEDAGYAGMAGIYRDYLDLSGKRETLTPSGTLPLFLETAGALRTQVSTAGFVHDTLVALTGYEDNVRLVQALRERGVGRVELILTGWMNGGVDPGLADGVDLIRALGGKKGFSALTDWTAENDVGLHPQVLLGSFSTKEGIMTQNRYASRSLDNKKSSLPKYDIASGSTVSDGARRLLSPTWQSAVGRSLLEDLQKLGVRGTAIGDIGSRVYSDYSESHEALRQTARLSSRQLIAAYAAAQPELLLSAPNDLSAPYAHLYTDVPQSSSGLSLSERSVPFYQLVFHGYAEYSFSALNYDADLTRSVLKCAEYGACPKFSFVAREDDRLTAADDGSYYASYYERWLDSAGTAYAMLDGLLSPVRGVRMTQHARVAGGVYRTGYENGYAVYVNYNDAAVTVAGIEIPAHSAVGKGEGA